MMKPSRREFLASSLGLAAGLLPGRGAPAQTDERRPIVDCHTHFYDPTRPEGVPWPAKDDAKLYRTVLPEHFLAQAASVGVTKTVVIEASPRLDDNAWLLKLAAANRAIVGVVGNLTPGRPEFAGHLQRFARNKVFRGIRIGHEALRAGIEQAAFVADLRRLGELRLTLDVNGGQEMPSDVARLAEKLPDLAIVVNHLANVDVNGRSPPKDWLAAMNAAASHPRVFRKVSALVEHAKLPPGETQVPADVDFYRPVLDGIWELFGDDRLIYGSNWPVSDRFAPYRTVFSIASDYVRQRGPTAVEKFFSANSRIAYLGASRRVGPAYRPGEPAGSADAAGEAEGSTGCGRS